MKNEKVTEINQKSENNANKATGRKKGRRSNNCRRGTQSKSRETEVKDDYSSRNDPSWYGKNPELLKDAASINTSNVSGDSLLLEENVQISYTSKAVATPGICTLETSPSIGHTRGGSKAVNMAAKNIYSFVRHANSGASNYDAPDLMMAILAADQVFSMLAHAIRAYGTAMVYNQKDRYTPEALITSMGFDFNDIMNNLANYRYRINQLIAQASVIWVPSNMPIVARHFWMYSNIYRDSEDDKAQYYLMVPASTWKFEPATSEQGSSLSVINFNYSAATKFSTFLDTIQTMLSPIVEDEDMGIMFGDLLKAYGKDNLFSLNMIEDMYTVLPVHNREVLSQIHNSTAVSVTPAGVFQTDTGVIYEGISELGFFPSTRSSASVLTTLLNFWEKSPSPETVMVSTRLHALSHRDMNENDAKCTLICGTEYVRLYRLYQYENGVLVRKPFRTLLSTNEQDEIDVSAELSKFDWAPQLHVGNYTAGATQADDRWVFDSLYFDLDNFTIVGDNALIKMNETALFSEFGVPIQV